MEKILLLNRKKMMDSLDAVGALQIYVRKNLANMKLQWHSAVKEVAYKIFDLSNESWIEYTIFVFRPKTRGQVFVCSPLHLKGGMEGALV